MKTIKEFEDIRMSMDGKVRAIDNVWIERFFRTLKHEHVYLQPSNNGHDLRRSIKTFVHYYNNQRKHLSLQYRTSASVYHAQATSEKNDGTTGNQPDGAKLSHAYANVKVKPSGLQVKKSVKNDFFTANLDIRSAISIWVAQRFECQDQLDENENADNRPTIVFLTLNQNCPRILECFNCYRAIMSVPNVIYHISNMLRAIQKLDFRIYRYSVPPQKRPEIIADHKL